MNYKTIFNITVSTFALSQLLSSSMQAGFGGQWPTQEQIEQSQEIYRQELERFESLSPEEQTQYLDDIIESMSPEERQQLEELERYFASDEFQQLYQDFADEFATPSPPQGPSIPTPAAQPPAPVKTQKELEQEKNQEEAIAALARAAERIAHSIEALQVIAASIPDFKTDVDEWAEDKDIQPWQAGMTWELFSSELQKIIQLLLKTTQYDSARKQYPYMKHALEKQGLRKIIEQLDQSLETLLTQARELKAGSKQQERILKNLLSTLSQAIIGQKLPDQLNELVGLFAPEAEELKKQIGAQEQQALQQTRIPVRSRPVVKAGKPVAETPYISRPTPSPSRKQKAPRKPSAKSKRPTLEIRKGKASQGNKGAGPGKAPDAGKGKKSTSDGNKKKRSKDGKDKKDKADKDKKEDKTKDKVADEFLQGLESALVRMSATIASIDMIAALGNATISATDLSNLAGQARGMQTGIQDLRRAATQFTQRLQALPSEGKKKYTDKAKKQLSISKKEIDRFARAINTQNPNTLESVKTRYTFFTAPGTDEAAFAGQLSTNQRQQYNDWIATDVPTDGAPLGPERTRLSQQRIELRPIGQALHKAIKDLDKIR